VQEQSLGRRSMSGHGAVSGGMEANVVLGAWTYTSTDDLDV